MSSIISDYPHKNSKPIERFAYWIYERENIRKRHDSHKHMPYTKNPILAKYRFCNVHREHDRVTRWIATNWRDDSPTCWHAMIIARFLNWPPTLEYCGYPEPWGNAAMRNRFVDKLRGMEKHGARIFTGAYIVSTNGATGSKVEHVIKLFDRSWKEMFAFHKGIPKGTTLQQMYEILRNVNGIGSFMAAQVVADLKYVQPLNKASDWMNFVAPGPGSQRGLNRILELDLDKKWNNREFQKALISIRSKASEIHAPILSLHLQDLQNTMCEFDKYERVLHNQGKPRSQYHPSTEPLPGL